MLSYLISGLVNAFNRVSVRATLYSVFGMMAFALTSIMLNYQSQKIALNERFEVQSRLKAENVANSAAHDIHLLSSSQVGRLLNAVTDDIVIAAKAYTMTGREFASNSKSENPAGTVLINARALEAVTTGEVQVTETPNSLEYIVPTRYQGEIVGSVLVKVSKDELKQLGRATDQEILFTLGLLVAVFGPIVGFLMNRATAGLSEIAETAMAASEGFLDFDFELKTKSNGEVLQLQTVFRKMMLNMRDSIQEIRRLVFTDQITKLPNRTQLEKTAAEIIEDQTGSQGAVFYIGLDRFKLVNDMHGYMVGDMVLATLAGRLKRISEECAKKHGCKQPFIARFSGDEFIVLLVGELNEEQVEDISSNLVDRMGRSFWADQLYFTVSVSIGVVQYSGNTQTATEVFQNANLAMYKAKCSGRARPVRYTPQLRAEIVEKELLETRLFHALENHSLSVFYQPKVEIGSDRIVGAEALLRWNDPELGKISPEKFIPIAEETGLIVPIGEFVLQQALEDIGQAREMGFDLSIAVNVSPFQLYSPNFTDRILGVIGESAVPAEQIELEITESSLMDFNECILEKIIPIRDEGVSFAIDDFGTGYSCLNSLANMPFNTLKIDRSFVCDLANSEGRRKIIELILMMARQLNMETVSEGIETESQLEYIKTWGGKFGQGFLWSPPKPLDQFRLLLNQNQSGLSHMSIPATHPAAAAK